MLSVHYFWHGFGRFWDGVKQYQTRATHSIEALGDKLTVTFSSYGETHHSKRFEFDPVTYIAKNF
ncbi:hypothetical protein J5X98_15540 [Leptothermofonsia sichuanensis E412]|uniref:hypothetical protein n=1 Tax=Leptothermofonsia sichuanensis TaxID=2917832 RepID=UPI001CA6818B|nr:hypothetical protein [Leptothermofonsia sichuanensis]QZZ18866.1 hypothetical protein J5X98_15540 [Leptothermofonsia sichuanensis E412]